MVVKKIGTSEDRDSAGELKVSQIARMIGTAVERNTAGDVKRQMSGTNYPYFDLSDSVTAAEAIHQRGGGVAQTDQLAAWLGYQTVKSGTFATRVSSMRQFQLLEPQPIDGKLVITERARTILAPVMPDDRASSLAEAFLSVPLFRALFERFRGATLPPDSGLRNLLEHTYRIIPDRVPQALRVFKTSADYAGFFKEGPDRLVRPSAPRVITGVVQAVEQPDTGGTPQSPAARGFYGGGEAVPMAGAGGVDTAIIGLLRKLPAPGESWTAAEQKRFLTAFTHTIEFLYPVKGEADDA